MIQSHNVGYIRRPHDDHETWVFRTHETPLSLQPGWSGVADEPGRVLAAEWDIGWPAPGGLPLESTGATAARGKVRTSGAAPFRAASAALPVGSEGKRGRRGGADGRAGGATT
jgi:hypothetical protein